MKHGRIFAALAAGVGIVCAVSCSSVQKKNTVAMDQTEVRRTLAGMVDAGVVGPNGEVILFYKNGNKIVVEQCGDYTVLNRREDCKVKDGTSIAQVPVDEFKNRLKQALKLPIGDYSPAMKHKIDLYKQGKPGDIADLEKQRADLQAAIDQIQAFIDTYGAENADLAKKAQVQSKLDAVNQKLADNAELAGAIRDINNLVDRLVDQIIGQPTLTKFVYSKERQGFEFNILRAYVRTPGLSATFAKIPRGTFQMGSPGSESGRWNDEVLHTVTIRHDFEMEVTDVTQLQWFLVMGYNPSYFKSQQYCKDDYIEMNGTGMCPNNPVEQVSWHDTQAFIQRLNDGNDGYTYRLPTEAEWEYAARAGSQAAYYFGDDAGQLSNNAWYSDNSGGQTHAVGGKTANAFGLYDMSGNVWQWVQDWYGDLSTSKVSDPTGASSGSYRVVRGGSWGNVAQGLRSANRYGVTPDLRLYYVGFRLVRTQ